MTGGGRGIGAALAGELRTRGAEVVTVDLRTGADVACDVSDAEQVAALFAGAGRVDGLVNCAALLVDRRPFDEIDLAEWDRMFAVNVRGRSSAPRRRRERWAPPGQHRQRRVGDRAHRFTRIRPLRRVEGAVISMTRALANELGPRGIRVNCVAPGFTPTPGSECSAPTTRPVPRSGG